MSNIISHLITIFLLPQNAPTKEKYMRVERNGAIPTIRALTSNVSLASSPNLYYNATRHAAIHFQPDPVNVVQLV